jgi:hypothetical protein
VGLTLACLSAAAGNVYAEQLSFWAAYAVAFIVRPPGALMFGEHTPACYPSDLGARGGLWDMHPEWGACPTDKPAC